MEKNEYGVVATDYRHMDLVFEPGHQLVWARFKYPGLPCMSKGLLEDVARAQEVVVQQAKLGCHRGDPNRLMYQVLCSGMQGVFNLGGDLALLMELIHAGDRDALAEYAIACIDVLYRSACSYDLPFTTIALVQGETLGGGFEAALSANTLIAEKGARFGFPETAFGLFPGMGAFSFLARRLSPATHRAYGNRWWMEGPATSYRMEKSTNGLTESHCCVGIRSCVRCWGSVRSNMPRDSPGSRRRTRRKL